MLALDGVILLHHRRGQGARNYPVGLGVSRTAQRDDGGVP